MPVTWLSESYDHGPLTWNGSPLWWLLSLLHLPRTALARSMGEGIGVAARAPAATFHEAGNPQPMLPLLLQPQLPVGVVAAFPE